MGIEIERKFVVADHKGWRWATALAAIEAYYKDARPDEEMGVTITQGYLSDEASRTVRIRLQSYRNRPPHLALLTIKGKTEGISRAEYEYSIPPEDGEDLLKLCKTYLTKNRYAFECGGSRWEIDEFEGKNEGLVLAEIELQTTSQSFNKPLWVGAEVSDDSRFFNSNLAINPYCNWPEPEKPRC